MRFSKYSGAGNDFILIDNRELFFSPSWVPLLCDRYEGIGADGVLLLDAFQNDRFSLRIFNADGSEAEMCGNGIRCFTLFLQELGFYQTKYSIENIESKIFETAIKENGISVKMSDVPSARFFQKCQIDGVIYEYHFLNTGVPHIVVFTPQLRNIDLENIGKKLRLHNHFAPQGTNVNFAFLDEDNIVHVRTYERGVEKETQACGTGSCASALAACHIYHLKPPIPVKVKSKAFLTFNFQKTDKGFEDVTMSGPAKKVFEGSFLIEKSGILER